MRLQRSNLMHYGMSKVMEEYILKKCLLLSTSVLHYIHQFISLYKQLNGAKFAQRIQKSLI